jgi:pumilio homology domain family member 6
MYKCLLQGGHFSAATRSIARSDSFSPAAFASAFVKIVGREVTVGMAKGNGAFVVAELCERLREEGAVEERECVKGWFGADELNQIEDGDGKGSRVLLEKVRVL